MDPIYTLSDTLASITQDLHNAGLDSGTVSRLNTLANDVRQCDQLSGASDYVKQNWVYFALGAAAVWFLFRR